MILKKIFYYILLFLPVICFATESAPYDFQSESDSSSIITITVGGKETNTSKIARDQMLNSSNSILNGLINAFNLDPFKNSEGATYYIRVVINYTLGLVGLIAMVSLVLGFYRMFVSDNGTEAFARALKLVKGTIIAIFLLGFSWTIISFLLNVFFKISLFPTTTT